METARNSIRYTRHSLRSSDANVVFLWLSTRQSIRYTITFTTLSVSQRKMRWHSYLLVGRIENTPIMLTVPFHSQSPVSRDKRSPKQNRWWKCTHKKRTPHGNRNCDRSSVLELLWYYVRLEDREKESPVFSQPSTVQWSLYVHYMYLTLVNIYTAQWSIYIYRTVVTICTAEWSIYVPHSGHYMYRTLVNIYIYIYIYIYRTVVTICTAEWSLYVPHSDQNIYRTVVTICTAQWSLYVLPSGHYMYSTVVTICTVQWSPYVPTVVTICTAQWSLYVLPV